MEEEECEACHSPCQQAREKEKKAHWQSWQAEGQEGALRQTWREGLEVVEGVQGALW